MSCLYPRLFCILLGLFSIIQVSAQDAPAQVVVTVLQSAPLNSNLQLSGTIKSRHHAHLSVAVAALVESLHVDVGNRVDKGAALVSLDDNIAKSAHIRAKAQLSAADVAHQEAKRLFTEAKQLRKQNHIGESEVKARENAAQLASARLNEAKAELLIAKEQLAHHKLQAPFAGVISQRHTELGQWLSPGDSVFTLVSLDDIFLDVQIPQEYFSISSYITQVSIRPDTQPSVNLPAAVEALVPVGETARSFLLRLRATQASKFLLPGTSAEALLVFEQPETSLLIPRDALLRNVDGGYSVFIVENGQAKRRSITLKSKQQNDYWVESGLKAGEQVVIRGNELLRDEQAVVIVENRTEQQ